MSQQIKLTISVLTVSFLAMFFVTSCLKETPNEIHERLIPEIAAELISKQDSPRIIGLPPEVKAILKSHVADGMSFQMWAPELNGEAGIRFYTKKDHRRFLSIALDLHESEKSYLYEGFSETNGD